MKVGDRVAKMFAEPEGVPVFITFRDLVSIVADFAMLQLDTLAPGAPDEGTLAMLRESAESWLAARGYIPPTVRIKDTCAVHPGETGTIKDAYHDMDNYDWQVSLDSQRDVFFSEDELAATEEFNFTRGVVVDTVGALVDLLTHAPRNWPLVVNYDGSGRVSVCGLSDSADEPIVRLAIDNADRCEWSRNWPLSDVAPKRDDEATSLDTDRRPA